MRRTVGERGSLAAAVSASVEGSVELAITNQFN
jgi:hypothetical protein